MRSENLAVDSPGSYDVLMLQISKI